MIKAVIFDLDGTLIDSETHYVNGTVEWLKSCNVNTDFKTICGIIGKSMDDTYSYIANISGLNLDFIKQKNTEYFSKINPLDFSKALFSDVKRCFEELKKQNIKVCICSMSEKEYIKKFIDDCKLADYVDYYLSGYDCVKTKPDPEIYNNMINKLNIDKKEVLIVEDAWSGIKAGIDSGAYVVARNSAKFGFNQSDALRLFEDLKELSTIIMEINNGKYD